MDPGRFNQRRSNEEAQNVVRLLSPPRIILFAAQVMERFRQGSDDSMEAMGETIPVWVGGWMDGAHNYIRK